MEEKQKYIVVVGDNLTEFTLRINHYAKQGYVLYENMLIDRQGEKMNESVRYLQPMILA